MDNIRTDYLSDVFYPETFKAAVDKATERLREFDGHTPFDSIAFTGVSGAAFAFPLSLALNKTLLCVRKKKGESSHSPYEVEGNYSSESYVIVDDFISSGATVMEIQRMISRHVEDTKPAAIYLYRDYGGKEKWDDLNGGIIPVLSQEVAD